VIKGGGWACFSILKGGGRANLLPRKKGYGAKSLKGKKKNAAEEKKKGPAGEVTFSEREKGGRKGLSLPKGIFGRPRTAKLSRNPIERGGTGPSPTLRVSLAFRGGGDLPRRTGQAFQEGGGGCGELEWKMQEFWEGK